MAWGRIKPSDRSVPTLLVAQSISTFNHSLLRSAIMALVSFRGLTAFGLSAEATVAVGTVLIVLPYVLFSLAAGRLADRFDKAKVVTIMMALDVAVMGLGSIGLMMGHSPMLLGALLLAGIQATLLGPAKFAVLPDIVRDDALLSGNGWLSATGTVAILLGLSLGTLLILNEAGFWIIVVGAPALSMLGACASLWIKRVPAKAPHLSLQPMALLHDFRAAWGMLRRSAQIVWPLAGSCWFWFQGTVFTALLPLYVAKSGMAEQVASVFLLSTALGVALGALAANQLVSRVPPIALALGLLPVIILPIIDFAVLPHGADALGIGRLALDLFVSSAGAGFYLVPLTAAIQRLTPPQERARFVGISHTLSGFAMCLGGASIFVFPLIGFSVIDIFVLLALVTGGLGAMSLLRTLRAGDRHSIKA